jgi:DNA-binding Lrp family transcriptional regulator
MPETTVDVEALYAALDNKRKAHGTSWREIARQLGVSPSTCARHGT